VLVCVLQEQRKTIAVLQVQESSKNKNEIETEREFGLQQMSAAEPLSGMGEIALRD
jgi:hypothetical protein